MYDHYVAVDWAMSNMAIAKLSQSSNIPDVIDVPTDIKDLKVYLKNLKGTVCLTIEEMNCSHWLYTELNPFVEKLIICDPFRNRLLSEGAKTDKIDAVKLVKLLKGDLLKEVYHSNDKFIELRKIVSSYNDLIQSGVRLKNQRSALFRSINMNHKKEIDINGESEIFILEGLDAGIEVYEKERKRYQKHFDKLEKEIHEIKILIDIPGIGNINAVKIVSRVVEAKRFENRNRFLSYCGLIKLDRISGGRLYGKKIPRYCPVMKCVFKSAALMARRTDNPLNDYYQYLIDNKKYNEKEAKNALARKIATVVYGVLKSGKKYKAEIIKKNKADL